MSSDTRRCYGSEAGYNLVALMVILVVINIAVAAALPMWSSIVRRDQEEELLFRGWQYAEAIRVFKERHGRNPISLEEMVEVRPRCLRQLWTDPVSVSGEWEILLAGTGEQLVQTEEGEERPGQGQIVGGGRPPGGRIRRPGEGFGSSDRDRPTSGALPGDQQRGPIDGVRPSATGAAFKSFLGRTEYGQWEFRASMLSGPLVNAAGVPQSPRLDVGALTRPFPSGLQPLSGQNVPRPVPDGDRNDG